MPGAGFMMHFKLIYELKAIRH